MYCAELWECGSRDREVQGKEGRGWQEKLGWEAVLREAPAHPAGSPETGRPCQSCPAYGRCSGRGHQSLYVGCPPPGRRLPTCKPPLARWLSSWGQFPKTAEGCEAQNRCGVSPAVLRGPRGGGGASAIDTHFRNVRLVVWNVEDEERELLIFCSESRWWRLFWDRKKRSGGDGNPKILFCGLSSWCLLEIQVETSS